jgi:amino acid transporter
MGEERPLLFVRRASGLTRAISSWTVLFFGLGVGFMPWHYFLMSVIPQWFPGVNLPFIYLVGGAFVFVEVTSMALIYVAIPRSGSIYVPVSRANSPMLGMLEAWRSVITNPTQRGVTAFIGAGQIASFMVVTGQLTGNPSLQDLGASLSGNVWLLVAVGLLFQIIGWTINFLGPGAMGKWVGFWGAGAVFGIIVVNSIYAATPPTAVPARWDATFGPGAYNEIVNLATQNGFTPTPLNWGATLSALLLPVSNTWPYTVMPVVGEVEKPRRNIPFSMMGSALALMIINTISAYHFTSRMGDFANMYAFVTGNPDLAAQLQINKPFPADLSSYAAALSAGSPMLAGLAAWAPQWSNQADVILNCAYTDRPLFAMAMDRMAPEFFAKVHPRFHSPYVGTTFWFLWSLITLFLSAAFVETISAVVFGITFVYAFARMFQHWSELELPFTRPEIYRGGFKLEIAGYPVMSILGAFSTAMFLYLLATNPANPVESALLIALVYGWGSLMYIYYGKKNLERGIQITRIYSEVPPE